uniref:uncharacterized protein LOC125397516 n=1 Tax=Myodes glareolus TaxID=447135 RepID=UPI0020219004|nr:uncharacterized protein LOC125397516 [Myodes glareolus]
MKRRGHPEGGSLRNPELTEERRRCVGTGSRLGRELAQPGGLLPGQAFPQTGPARRPSRSGRPRSPCPELEGHPGHPRPPTDTHSVPAPTVTQQPKLRNCPWNVSSSQKRGGAQRSDGVEATSGLSPLLLAVTPRPELRLFREPFFFRAEGEVCCGQGLVTEALTAFPSHLATSPVRFFLQSFQSSAEPWREKMPMVVLECGLRSWDACER